MYIQFKALNQYFQILDMYFSNFTSLLMIHRINKNVLLQSAYKSMRQISNNSNTIEQIIVKKHFTSTTISVKS